MRQRLYRLACHHTVLPFFPLSLTTLTYFTTNLSIAFRSPSGVKPRKNGCISSGRHWERVRNRSVNRWAGSEGSEATLKGTMSCFLLNEETGVASRKRYSPCDRREGVSGRSGWRWR